MLSASLALSPPAWSENEFHVGASIGSASISDDRFFIADSSRAYKLYGGYQFSDNFAAEAAFVDFDDVTGVIIINTAAQRAVADGYGFSVVGMAQFPIGRFALTAKAGVLFWQADSGTDSVATEREDGSDLLTGVGLRFQLTDRVSLTIDYESYEIGDIEADVGLLGIRASF